MRLGIFKILLFLVVTSVEWKIYAQNIDEVSYQRSSVIQMMIEHPMYMFNDEVAEAFKKLPVSSRFNNHNLGVRVVKFASQEFSDQQNNITSFARQVKLGNRAIAKWFNWDKQSGTFNMDLVKERGLYNASALDQELAAHTIRGSAILSDAGEKLIPNTYLIMSDICYKGVYSNKEAEMQNIGYRSFDVKIISYIYQLEWDNDKLNEFYTTYYSGCRDFVNNAKQYDFIFRAKVETDYGEKSNAITQAELIERVVGRCLDVNIAKLQRAYPDFRIKALVTSSDPIQAEIGLKECVTPGSLFEVLEMQTNDKGITTYHRVGIVTPIADKIWDNRYMAEKEGNPATQLKATTFKAIKGKQFYPGMLIREMEP